MGQNVFSNEGEILLAERCVRVPFVSTNHWTARLYTNDYTPTKDVTLASVVEAVFPGYAGIDLIPGSWNPFTTVNGQATSFYGLTPLQWFTTTVGQVCHGYYVTDNLSGILIWAARFDAPQLPTTTNPALVLPAFTLHSESEP